MKKLKEKKYSILSTISKYSFVFTFIFVLIMPFIFVNNANGADSGVEITTKIVNPLGEKLTDIPSFIHEVVQIVLYVGIPIIALAIIYTGLLFVMAQGNSEKITKAKKALLYTLIGGALLLGAFVIANAIKTTVDDIKNG